MASAPPVPMRRVDDVPFGRGMMHRNGARLHPRTPAPGRSVDKAGRLVSLRRVKRHVAEHRAAAGTGDRPQQGRHALRTRHGLEIRAATSADAAGLSELLGTAGLVVPARILGERLDAIRQGYGAVLIAVEWGPPSGVINSHWYRTLNADQPTAQVTTLLVGPEDRRRGIGRLLVKAAAQAARVAGCDAMEVLAAPHQQDLHDFYRATGFIEAGPRFVRALRKKG
jgi:aminoglycoside 6'-N-acetyltransferase I